jgi:pimeloyl-ACP methyl ester carboxylesterase
VTSLFDTPHFNAQLFFPRADSSPCPPGAVDHRLAMEAGVTLHARLHRTLDARATILLFHGNGEVVADYDELASSFHDVGADLALVDFRGYGLSTGTPTLRTAIDDAPRALSLLRRELRTPLIVFGRSLGGVCAAELAGRADTGAVGIVLESSGADLGTLLARRGFAPQPLSAEEQRVFSPGPKLARCTMPTLVLHGAEDRLISPDEARMNATALGASLHELVLVPNRGHNDLSLSTVYWDALRRFIDRVTT